MTSRNLGAVVLALISAGMGARVTAARDCTPAWDATIGQPGVTGPVYALAVFDDGGGEALYAGGSFSQAGGTSASNIAKWNGTQWSALGTGTNNAVYALAVYDDGTGPALYLGGAFTTAGGLDAHTVAKWTGSAWDTLGEGIDNGTSVNAMAVFDDGSGMGLYVAGDFTLVGGGTSANRVAKWNGSTWSGLGVGLNGIVSALAAINETSVLGPALYVGGSFSTAGGVSASRVAKWSEERAGWSPLGDGTNNSVFALAPYDDGRGAKLFAGGKFTQADGLSTPYIAQWNGFSWSGAGGGMNDRVHALTVFDDGGGSALYAGGEFTLAGGVAADHIAKWNSTTQTWSSLSGGTNNDVWSLYPAQGLSPVAPGLHVGGVFSIVGGEEVAARIATWTGCAEAGPGDCNGDGNVDLEDYTQLVECYTGPNTGSVPSECECVDFDGDDHVDLEDFAAFQSAYTGG